MKKTIFLFAITLQLLSLSLLASNERKHDIQDENESSCSEIKPVDYYTKDGSKYPVYPARYLECLKGVEKQNVIIIDVMGV